MVDDNIQIPRPSVIVLDEIVDRFFQYNVVFNSTALLGNESLTLQAVTNSTSKILLNTAA